jgi:hypothetical protein
MTAVLKPAFILKIDADLTGIDIRPMARQWAKVILQPKLTSVTKTETIPAPAGLWNMIRIDAHCRQALLL